MFDPAEVILLMLLTAVVAGYVAFKIAEFRLLAKMISLLTEKELRELDELKQKLDNATDEDIDRIIEEAGNKIQLRMLKEEIVDGQTFFYDFNDNFVCQGQSTEHAIAMYEMNNKSGARACVVKEDGEKYFIVGGKVTQTLES
jgi:hypothetical protein